MVEYQADMNLLFGSLSDPTRRDILERLKTGNSTISNLASKYGISFAAVAKHLIVLTKANLISKTKKGNEQWISLVPATLREADKYISQFERNWSYRFMALENLLSEEE